MQNCPWNLQVFENPCIYSIVASFLEHPAFMLCYNFFTGKKGGKCQLVFCHQQIDRKVKLVFLLFRGPLFNATLTVAKKDRIVKLWPNLVDKVSKTICGSPRYFVFSEDILGPLASLVLSLSIEVKIDLI